MKAGKRSRRHQQRFGSSLRNLYHVKQQQEPSNRPLTVPSVTTGDTIWLSSLPSMQEGDTFTYDFSDNQWRRMPAIQADLAAMEARVAAAFGVPDPLGFAQLEDSFHRLAAASISGAVSMAELAHSMRRVETSEVGMEVEHRLAYPTLYWGYIE